MSTEDSITYTNRDDKGSANKLWLLVEYRTFAGKISRKNYEVIEAKDVCGPSGPDNSKVEPMHTGNIVHIRGEKGLVQATVVTISDDKYFLDRELTDMRQLHLKDSMTMKKRKRESSTGTRAESPYGKYQSWNAMLENDQSNQSILVSSRGTSAIVQQSRPATPPMTFCQQTQTDFKGSYDGLNGNTANTAAAAAINEAKLTKIVQTQAHLTADIQQIKQQVNDMNKQLVDVKSMLSEILAKCGRPESRNGEHKILVTTTTEPFSPLVTRSQFNPPKILNLSHSSNVSQTFSNAIIEPIEASNDSSYSFSNNSRMSMNASNQSIYQNDSPNRSNSEVDGKIIVQSMSIERLNGSHSNLTESIGDEDGGNPNDEVTIGNNGTTVPRHILANINWNSHTSATRRLLIAKFTREVLATHSLTGKPSPGKLNCPPVIIVYHMHYTLCKKFELINSYTSFIHLSSQLSWT